MLSRKSRKIRTSEPILHDIPQNNILIELTTPSKDGTIPLVNFLENTERFLGDNANMITRVYELEREITRYKSVFRRYDDYLDKMSQVTNKSVEKDEQPGNVRTIRDYFKPIHQNQKRIEEMVSNVVTQVESNSKPEQFSKKGVVSNHKIEIDHQLKENVKEMEGILSQMKNRKMEVGTNKEFSKCTINEKSKGVIATTNAQPKQPVANVVNYKKIDNIRLSYDSSETKTMFTSSASMFGLIKQGDVLNIVHNDTVSAIPSDYLVVKKIHSSRLFETTAAATNIDSSAADSIASDPPNLVVRQIIFRQSTEQVSAAM
jgi:hypothetical protein